MRAVIVVLEEKRQDRVVGLSISLISRSPPPSIIPGLLRNHRDYFAT